MPSPFASLYVACLLGDTMLGSKITSDQKNQTCKNCVNDQTWAKRGLSELGFWRPVPRVELGVCSSTFCVVCSLEEERLLARSHPWEFRSHGKSCQAGHRRHEHRGSRGT